MKAVFCSAYGSPNVLRLAEIPKPAPGPDEILIRVRATTVTSADWRVRSRIMPRGFGLLSRLVLGVTRPRQPILGTELAGDVEAIGRDVRSFRVGDPVFAFAGAQMACHAEYRCFPATSAVALKPANLSHEEAAALSFGGVTSLEFFRRAGLQKGERVLINGASGGIGTAAVQLAVHFGAEVTGVCSTRNLDLVRSLGAAEVIDYTADDFSQNGKRYDVIMDTVGTAPFVRCKHSLAEGGRLLLVTGSLPELINGAWTSATSNKMVIGGQVHERPEYVRFLAGLAQESSYRPVIDRLYPIDRIAEPHQYVGTGRKRGSVVITL